MKNSIQIAFLLVFAFFSCKDKGILPNQTLGLRYSNYTQWIYKEAGSKKKEDQVTLVYGFEEVTALENKEIEVGEGKDKKKETFLLLRTVDNKEGYASTSGFSEAIYFVTENGLDAYLKPTLTSGTKGKLSRGTYCLLQEIIGEFAKVDCKETMLPADGSKLNDFYNVWIEYNSPSLSKDPTLGETVKTLRQASLDFVKINPNLPANELNNLHKSNIKELEKVLEKNDVYAEEVRILLEKFNASQQSIN
ncbi:MAG: lipoprotein LenA [Leptospira sp.]|nr:lipoprotein LenA [Leptospira sp.]